MRVLVKVAEAVEDVHAVEVDVGLEGERRTVASHAMRRLSESPWVAPEGDNVPGPDEPHAYLVGGDLVERREFAKRLDKGRPQAGEVELLGRYLFDSLLGRTAWEEILAAARSGGAKAVELALIWPAGERGLHRPCWETLHDGEGFLGACASIPVAITRVVADADVEPPQTIQAPARMLFALGAELKDERIRAGAEVIGLLCDAERGERAIDAAVLERATIGKLEKRCARFRPDVVHFVSHGRFSRATGGQLELQRQEGDDSGWVGAEKLLDALRSEEGLPALVVLTGCESAAWGSHMDSLAAELVRGGVPCVIGMAGKISDPVCRLFSRRFGMALNDGLPLVEALTHARRAGLQKQAGLAADDIAWALPSICLAPAITADYAPVDTQNASAVLKRFHEYGLMREPVFCGRSGMAGLFDDLLDPDEPLEVLVAYASGDEQLGKTRLLHEFAGRALRGGHLVAMIDDRGNDITDLPSTPLELAVAMLGEIAKLRKMLKLPVPQESVLLAELERVRGERAQLGAIADEGARWARLESFRAECRERRPPEKGIAGSLRAALGADLTRLIREARESPDPTIDDRSRLIVVLGGLGRWGTATDLIARPIFDAAGFGDGDEHIPVFATCALPDDEVRLLEAREKARGLGWIRYEPLCRFEAGEDTLAYRWVLLHPREIAGRPPFPAYVPNLEPDGHEETWRRKFEKYIEGIPGRFDEIVFEAVVEDLQEKQVLVEADDDDVMSTYLKRQP